MTILLPVIQNGDEGDTALALQRILKAAGYKGADGKALTLDGDFGANTQYAVRQFQKRYGLTVDGVVGEKTWRKLLGV